MRVDAVELQRIQIPFKARFAHAKSERDRTDAVIVAIRSEGLRGYGEILPRPYVTGESVDTVLGELGPRSARRFLGRRFKDKDSVIAFLRQSLAPSERGLATFCGFELALLDLAGQHFGFPLADVVGQETLPALAAGVVLGFETPTRALPRACAVLRMRKKHHVKLKVGLPDDLERVRIVSDVFGHEQPIRIDANGAWSAREAVDAISRLAAYPIASVEQPVAAGDLEGMRHVRERTGVPVMADESLCTRADAERIIALRAADIFNVRLGKCGGVLASEALVELACSAGLSCNLGCLVGETGILSRAAEIFGRRIPGFACLDGKGQNRFLLEEDILTPMADSLDSDLESPGLGFRVSIERIRARRVGELISFEKQEELINEC